MADDSRLTRKTIDLLDACRRRGWTLATAESCTGGLIAATLTEIAGSSDVVDRGFVTYSNQAKTDMLRVRSALISRFGAVSRRVAEAMAKGAIEQSKADLAVSVTGIAGPGGATPAKPVGLVFIGTALRDGEVMAEKCLFDGNRRSVRKQTVERALDLLAERLTADGS